VGVISITKYKGKLWMFVELCKDSVLWQVIC